MPQKIAVHWFRRDLRLDDNAALHAALRSGYPVAPIFIFDTEILAKLEDRDDARVTFLFDRILQLREELRPFHATLRALQGKPSEVFGSLINSEEIAAVYTNRDYEPYARTRDAAVEKLLAKNNIPLYTYKDHVIFEYDEVLKSDGKPYVVFTPYARAWKNNFLQRSLPRHPSEKLLRNMYSKQAAGIDDLSETGFIRSAIKVPEARINASFLRWYAVSREFPGIGGTSHLGVHLRFGTVSIRKVVAKAAQYSETFLHELIWREFFQMLLRHFPHTAEHAFKKEFEHIAWRNNENEFALWCEGKTGFPLVDAGMRELRATGYMHNRARMITASFLTKDLLIDWRWGAAWFARWLLDYELASNAGGWQWAAGTGADAAPYFRIFNPELQQRKFDPQGKYISKWVREYDTAQYPPPMAVHAKAAERALAVYRKALARR